MITVLNSMSGKQATFGVWLRYQRNILRISRQQLADLTGIKWTHLQAIEQTRMNATDAQRSLILAVLDVLEDRQEGIAFLVAVQGKVHTVRAIVNKMDHLRPQTPTATEKDHSWGGLAKRKEANEVV